MSQTALTMESVGQAFSTQCRVIHALILRETLTRYGQHKLGFFWAILEPVLMTAVIVAIFTFFRSREMSGIPIAMFMLTGVVPFSLFKSVMTQLQGAVTSNRSLLGFPQVTTFDVLLARALLEIAVVLGVFALLLFIAHLVGFDVAVEKPLDLIAVLMMLAMMGTGMGFILASLQPLLPSVQQLAGVIFGRPLFLSSGIFFSAEVIPAPARDYLLYNPILHAMELLRSAIFAGFDTRYGDWSYTFWWALALLTAGLIVHQALRKRAVIGL